MSATTQPLTRQRHESVTPARHRVTAANVIFLCASAHIRERLEWGIPLKSGLQAVHLSCGIFSGFFCAGRSSNPYCYLAFPIWLGESCTNATASLCPVAR